MKRFLLKEKRFRLVELNKDLLTKKKRVSKAEKQFEEHCRNMKELIKNQGFLTQSKEELEKFLNQKKREMADLERSVKAKKTDYFKVEPLS